MRRAFCLAAALGLAAVSAGAAGDAPGAPAAAPEAAAPAREDRPYDVLDLPAVASPLAERSLVYSLTRAGARLVATGIRGHVLLSDDEGQSWRQAEAVPVRSSLLGAAFPTPELGWIVGHDGVILHTADGGRTWTKQLDGRRIPEIGVAYYEEKLASDPENETYLLLLDEMKLASESGPDRPLFAIFMRDAKAGVAAGAYGLLLRTIDGGANWFPVMEAVDSEEFVHLFDYVQFAGPAPEVALAQQSTRGDLMAVGEMGTVLVLDTATQRWHRAPDFPYDGSMFTAVATGPDAALVGGLRGLAFLTPDRGTSWQEVAKPETGAIVASTRLADGRIVIGTDGGQLLLSADGGASFALLPVESPQPLSDLIEGRPGELVLAGAAGLGRYRLPE